jgi:hypothetical protein
MSASGSSYGSGILNEKDEGDNDSRRRACGSSEVDKRLRFILRTKAPGGVAEQALAVVDDEHRQRPRARMRGERLQEPPAEEGRRRDGADDERFEVVGDGQHSLHRGVGDARAAGREVDVPPQRRLAEERIEQLRHGAEEKALSRR